jgi:uncharacterized protein
MSDTALRRRLLAAGLVLLAVTGSLAGCASAPVQYSGTGTVNGGENKADDDEEDAEDSDEEVASGLTDEQFEEFEEDMGSAVDVTDTFWQDHFTELFGGSYEAPTVVGLYDGYGKDVPECAGSPLDPENAFYCIPDDFVAWDVTLMVNGFAQGDTWVYLVIAHEWGHAIQARIDPALVAPEGELQADCFAGATLFGSQADGNLNIEDGDLAEITTALSLLADTTAWTSEGDHGDPFQRIGAFDKGKEGGVTACYPGSL